MHTGFLKTAALFGVLSVAFGAFAAHSLRQYIAESAVSIFETGVRYQFYHTFALLACGILYKDFQNKFIKTAGNLFISGIVLFSGSLYALTFIKGSGIVGYDGIGVITPLGGLSFIAGWICLFIGIRREKIEGNRGNR